VVTEVQKKVTTQTKNKNHFLILKNNNIFENQFPLLNLQRPFITSFSFHQN